MISLLLPCACGETVLVEIGLEVGRRHNSPLNRQASSERVTAEGPLGDEGKRSKSNSILTEQITLYYD
jgi:hypothetical protein